MKKEEIKNEFKSNGFKYWVLKIEDFIDALSEAELNAFNEMLSKHEEYRLSCGKTPSNSYWVVNRDDTPIDNLEDFLKVVSAEHIKIQ